MLEKVQGGLQHADMRLLSDILGDSGFGLRLRTTHLDAQKDKRLEAALVEQRDDLRRRH
jgi:hypothetical protein